MAAFLVWGMAWLPAASQAVMTASGVQWVEVCSAAGSRWVPVDATQEPGSVSPNFGADMANCPACCHLGHSAGLPPADSQRLVYTSGSQAVPVLFLHAPAPLFAWAVAQPRGPPRWA